MLAEQGLDGAGDAGNHEAGRLFKGFEVFVAGDEPWGEAVQAPLALVRREEGER